MSGKLGRSGRKPKPQRLGASTEAKTPGPLIQAPDYLTPTQHASWLYALDHAPVGALLAIDRALLTAWVISEDEFRIAVTMQNKMDEGSLTPLLARNRDGHLVQSPYLRIIKQASDRMIKAAAELGFTPTSRPRLGEPAQPVKARDETPRAESLEDFLNSGPLKVH